jgi:hypothetical protein
MPSMRCCWIMHCARCISPIQKTISIDLSFYADKTTFCYLPWPALISILYHLQGAFDAFIWYVTVWSFPLILLAMSRQNCFHQGARKETLLCCKVAVCLLTDLSCATNEISRSVTLTTFGLNIKEVKMASLHFFVCSFKLFKYLNPLQTKRRPLYLKTQSVPRCKHFSSRL